MTIYNKSGEPYELSQPNPIMKTQESWSVQGKKYIIYNKFGQKSTIESPKTKLKEVLVKEVIVQPMEVIQAEVKPTEEVKPPEIPDPKLPDIIDRIEPEMGQKMAEGVVEIWCLPAFYKNVTDSLNGETYKRVTYGNKFKTEAVIVAQEDLAITFYINTKAVTVGSIVYPRTYDKRWWRVNSIKQEQEGEYRVQALITDYQPNFSD